MGTETQWESLSQERSKFSGYELIYPFLIEKGEGKIGRIGISGQYTDDFLANDLDNSTYVFPHGKHFWVFGRGDNKSWKVTSQNAYKLLEQGFLRTVQVGDLWDVQWRKEESQAYLDSIADK